LNNIVTLKSGSEVTSLNVIEAGAIRKLGCGFLFAFHSNYGDILYRLRDIATYWVENREIFIPHLYLAPPHLFTCIWHLYSVPRRNFVKMFDAGKTRLILGYRTVKKTVTIC